MNNTTQFNIKGAKAIVTGGSKGIGADIALTLAKAGADLILSGRNQDDLENIKNEVLKIGIECITIVADLNDEKDIENFANQSIKYFGNIDILVNNAGIAIINDILNTTPKEWDEVMAINLKAPFLMSKLIAHALIL